MCDGERYVYKQMFLLSILFLFYPPKVSKTVRIKFCETFLEELTTITLYKT